MLIVAHRGVSKPVLVFLQPFCWLCGVATGMRHTWTQIDNHSCGRFKDEADAKVAVGQRSCTVVFIYA